MRPMWMEFREHVEISIEEADTQFMFGDSILVAPKIKQPIHY